MKKFSVSLVVLMAMMIGPALAIWMIFYGQIDMYKRQVKDLKQSIENEMAIKTASGLEWFMSNNRGSEKAREYCSLSDKGERIPSRHGRSLLVCGDPYGKSFKIYGYNLDGELVVIITAPHGREGPFADFITNPNNPYFTKYEIVAKK